ncbi:MAG: DUF3301 domain-containing protein [Gammaproteobacteria bacterium]
MLLLALLFALWQNTTAAREVAIFSARQTCQQLGYQLLDDTVAISNFSITGWQTRQFSLRRTYRFEYSADGENPSSGFIIVQGKKVENIGL